MQWGYKVMFWPWVCNVFSYPLADVVWWFLYIYIYIIMQHAYASYAHLIEELCTYIPLYTLLSSLPCLPICSDLFPSFPISFLLNRSPLLRLIPGFAGNKLVNQPFRGNLLGMLRSTPSIYLPVTAGFFSKIVSWDLHKFAPCFPDSPVARTVTNPVTNVGKTMS